MGTQNIGPVFDSGDIPGLFGDDFAASLTEAEAGALAGTLDSWLAGYILVNYIVFNPIKEEMDQILSPMAQ
jgi:hypothetical protein